MKIGLTGADLPKIQLNGAHDSPNGIGGKLDFKSILDASKGGPAGLDMNSTLTSIRDSLLSGHGMAPAELLRYQIASQQFNLKIELVSKVAESVSSTMRRFQSQG